MNRFITVALVVLILCIVSSFDTNRYIAKHYPDDRKLNELKAPFIGLIIVAVLLVLSQLL